MAPYIRLTDFLEGQEREHVRVWMEAQVPRMRPGDYIPDTGVTTVDPVFRDALVQMDTAMIRHHFDTRLAALAPYAYLRLGIPYVQPHEVELQVTRHVAPSGRFGAHIDNGLTGETRVLTAVWYHNGDGYNPIKGHGGELVIHAPDGDLWVPPVDNSVVIFPPYYSHEIRPVTGPGTRWAVSMWVRRAPDDQG